MRLVLWDIDGTLVDTAGHGARAFGDAFEAMFGRVPLGLVPMAGRTDHEIGGYGSDGGVRSQLVAVALGRAKAKHGVELSVHDAVLVGDTPLDVAAARAAGARSVAVASGCSGEDELREAGPNALLSDLSDTDAVLAAALA